MRLCRYEVTMITTEMARESHLNCTLHSAGTTIAGPWSEVMELIGQMHKLCIRMGLLESRVT